MKHLISTTLLLLAILLPATANAYDFEVDGIYYNAEGNNAIVTYQNQYYSEYYGDLTIPATVIFNGISYSVTAIGNSAFSGCSGLTSVTIPNSVVSIGQGAFWGCSGLTSINIPYTVTSISIYAFNGCSNLASVNIPNSVTSIGDYAFSDCRNLANLTIPNSVTTIGKFAFSGCSSLTNITIPNSITAISDFTFQGCNCLENIIIPSSVSYIGSCAFQDCISLANVNIPNSVTYIGECAFQNCSPLTSITFPSSVTYIGYSAFSGCSNLISVNIPNSTTYIGNNAFEGTIWYNNQPDGLVYAGLVAYKYKGIMPNFTHILIKDGTLSIADGLFENYSNLTNITIPNSVKYIGFRAFSGCIGLTNIDIPNSVTNINDHLFEGCSNLTNATIGNSVSTIGDNAFSGCKSLTSVNIPNSVTAIGNSAFSSCNSLANVIIGNSVKTIGNFAFDGCNSISNISIPNSVTSIGYRAFMNCYNLTNINIGNSVSSIDNDAFSYCSSLVSVNIPYSLKSIGYALFFHCKSLSRVTIPNSITSIGDRAFEVCSSLASITIPNSVTSIGERSFYQCSSLNRLTIPSSITAIGNGAFYLCNTLSSVIITGDEEWQAGALPESVDTLYICNGVTGVKGIKVNPEVIYSYATTPPVCDENSFTGYGAELHVPASSLAAYFTAPYWCNFTNIIGDAVAVTDLTINRDSVEMLRGEQITLHATVSPAGAVPNDISWYSTDQSVATVENGVITAIKGGECDIVATCQDKQAICHVVVTEILPTEVTLNQDEAKIEIGSQLNLTATVLPENTSNPTVTWRTTNSAVATVSNGVVTGVGQGECNIIASCGDKQAICHVIVVEHLIYITLDQHSASLLPNHIITLTPTMAPVATDLVVTSSNPAVAAARLAGDKIQVVGITEGHATIYVNSADGYAFSDSCLVEVYTERGDVNCDGFVNISDVTALIDVLLGGDVNHSEENADCNNDGKMTISDVTALIDALLGGAPLPEKNYEVITVNGVTFKMIKVQGGTFTMGATPDHGTEDPWNDEWPTHEVTVSSFSIGQTEVTQELWQAVMGSNPSYFTGDASRPVETVSWDECQQFIATLNQLTGMNFRMPTEAEWEYAARGGNMTEGYKYAGSNDINEIAWWDDNACDGVGESSPDYGTHPVALKKANELGLYDMSGNVWEWCQDWYGPYSEEAQINPTGPETGTDHLHRGGSWINYARNCRVSCRFHWVPDNANYVGLRLVK